MDSNNKKSGFPFYVSAGGIEQNTSNYEEKLKSLLAPRIPFTLTGKPAKKMPDILKTSKTTQHAYYGKEYPGARPLITYRALAWSSTVVFSIINFRRNQISKKEILLLPKDEEPAFRYSILDYAASEVLKLPSLDELEKYALLDIYKKVDPFTQHQRKSEMFEKNKNKLSKYEIGLIDKFNEQHLRFYKKRNLDKKQILSFLKNPDPYYSDESSWEYLISLILEDLLVIDRGAIIKVRDDRGKLVALVPVDGATIRPYLTDEGLLTHYVQVVDGSPTREYIDKRDVILFRMNVSPDIYMYGYGIPPIEVLYSTILADLFIDKGNIDYYRKGGSIPEGFIVVEPPGNGDDGAPVVIDKETLDSIQRQMQAILLSDYTQVPVVSGGKFSWIDFKGKRRDMQFKELAEYVTRKICAVYQVSPQDVGVLSDINRATAEVQASLTKAKGLETIANLISKNITRGVIDEFRDDLRLWFKDDDFEQMQTKWNILNQQLNTGFKSINQARTEEGYDPVPWGDTPLQGLKNWNPMESSGQAGPGGIPGIPGMQPGVGNEQGFAVPIPGQIPGQAPVLNQAPSIKSVLESIYENIQSDEYENMDVSGLVKTFFATVDEGDRTILNTLIQDTATTTVSLSDSVDFFLENAILKAGIYVTDIEKKRVYIYLKIPESLLDKKNALKITSYLFRLSDYYSLKQEPSAIVVELAHDVIEPLAPIKENTLVGALTRLLNTLFDGEKGFSQYRATIVFTPLIYEFDTEVIEITKDTTFDSFITQISEFDLLLSIADLYRPIDEENNKKLLNRLAEKAKESSGILSPKTLIPVFKLATTPESLNTLLSLMSERNARFYKKFMEFGGVDAKYIYKHEILPAHYLQQQIDDLFKKYKDTNYIDEFFRRAVLVSEKYGELFDGKLKAAYLAAHKPSLWNENSVLIATETDNHLIRIYQNFKKLTGEELETDTKFSINRLKATLNHVYSKTKASIPEPTSYDDATTMSLKQEIEDILETFNSLLDEYIDRPFQNFEESFVYAFTRDANQTLLMLATKMRNYSAVLEATYSILESEGISFQLVAVPTEFNSQEEVFVYVSDTLTEQRANELGGSVEQYKPVVLNVIKSLVRGDELTPKLQFAKELLVN